MANWISQQKGKVLKKYNQVISDHANALTGEVNKLWRAKIFLNRSTSGLPKDNPPGKMYNPNQTVGSGYTIRNPQKNPTANEATKEKYRKILHSGGTNDLGMNLDSTTAKEEEIVISRQPLAKHQEYKNYNNGSNQVIIYNLTSNGSYSYIVLQNRPSELEFRGETTWAAIKSMGRNNPMYHYTGAEDTLQFNISWYCSDPNNPAEVISKCRLLEAWSKANGYLAGPPILKIQWGNSGIFNEHKYILVSATYTLKNFQNGHIDRRDKNAKFIDTGLYPMVATQELIFKRVSDHNIGYEEIYNSSDLDKTKGISK